MMIKFYFLRFLLILSFFFVFQLLAAGQASSLSDYFRSSRTGSWSSAANWESSPDGLNWIAATVAPASAANSITIRNGHTITINSSVNADQLTVAAGGILELATTSSTALAVNDGPGSDIVVQSGGVFRHVISSGSSLPTFSNSSTLEIQGGGVLEVANNYGTPSDYANPNSAIASHIIWNDAAIFNWNTTTNPTSGITYFPATATIPVFRLSTNVTIGSTTATVINGILEANGNMSFSSSGTKTMRNGIIGNGTVTCTAASVAQFIINGTTAKLGGGILTLPDAGLSISSATTVTLVSNKTINKYSTTVSPVNLAGTMACGDFVITGTAKIQIDGTVTTSNTNGLTGSPATTFATGFMVNTLGTASTVEYNRAGDQIISPLSYKNLTISGTGNKTAGSGDILASGTVNIVAGNTFALNGTNDLKLNGGGTLNINANSSFDTNGESQITGTSYPTINISGTFITRDMDGFTGTNTSIPGATTGPSSPIIVNIYSGSTVEYGRAGDQQVTPRTDYSNLTFSGTGIKTLATCSPVGTVLIKDNVVVDASNKTFGDAFTNLTMTGGRFRVGGIGTKPDIAGTYNLTAGVIEFAGGTTSAKQTIRYSPVYFNVEVTGANVGNSLSTVALANGGSFTVKTNAVYDNNADKIDGVNGLQSFVLEAGATFKTGVSGGFSGGPTAALNAIETITVDPKATIVYSRGDQTITPLPAGYPTLLLKGGGVKTVASGNLDIAATADSVVIDPSVTLRVTAGFKANFNNRPIFIHSSASGTGAIGEVTDGPSAFLNAPNVTVERFIPSRRAFRLITPTVTTTSSIKGNWMEGQNNTTTSYSANNNNNPGYGTHITGSANPANGFDATLTNNPSLFTFDNSSQTWKAVANTNGTLAAGEAYRLLVRGSRNVDLTNGDPAPSNTILRTSGTLTVGTVTYNSNTRPSISGTTNYWSLVGNPYASPVDWNSLTKQNISAYYYVWDPQLNARGGYACYGNGATAPANSQANQHIQPGQAFFVQTTAPNPSLTFAETNKSTVNTNVFRSAASSKLSIQLLLNVTGGKQNTADGVMVLFGDDFSSEITNEDAAKINNLDENFSIVRKGVNLSIEERSTIMREDTVSLKMWQLKQKSYYLKVDAETFDNSVTAFIKDLYLNKETALNLSGATMLPFSITNDSASFSAGRFSIIMKANKVLPVDVTGVKAFKKERGIEVVWHVETEDGVKTYAVEKSKDGIHFEQIGALNATFVKNYNWVDDNDFAGIVYYRIKVIEISGSVKYSDQVYVNIGNDNGRLLMYPNPVKGNVLSIQVGKMKKGRYDVLLYNNAGQNVYNSSLYIDASNRFYRLNVGVISPGNYKVQISNGEEVKCENIIFE